jgi:hypothetical protein
MEEMQIKFVTLAEEKDKAAEKHLLELSSLKTELECIHQASIADLQAKHDAEKTEAAQAHASAISSLTESLKSEHAEAFTSLQSKHIEVTEKLAGTEQAHADAIALLREELKDDQSNDLTAIQAKLDEVQAQYEKLSEEKVAADRVHGEAVAELTEKMESISSEALKELQAKYDKAITREKDLEVKHAEVLEGLDLEHVQVVQKLKEEHEQALSVGVKLKEDVAASEEKVVALSKTLESTQRDLRASNQANERVGSALIAAKAQHAKEVTELVHQHAQIKEDDLANAERTHRDYRAHIEENLDRIARAVGVPPHQVVQDSHEVHELPIVTSLQEDVRLGPDDQFANLGGDLDSRVELIVEKHRKAMKEAEEAKARHLVVESERESLAREMEAMKGDVVRKHLAMIEPLEKENALLKEKVQRLDNILAAGDRVARAAATVGERRSIDTVEEDDEEDDESNEEKATPGADAESTWSGADAGTEVGSLGSSERVGVVGGGRPPREVLGTVSDSPRASRAKYANVLL